MQAYAPATPAEWVGVEAQRPVSQAVAVEIQGPIHAGSKCGQVGPSIGHVLIQLRECVIPAGACSREGVITGFR